MNTMKKATLFSLLFLILACQVEVEQIPVDHVLLDKSDVTLTEGDSESLTATVSPSNATNKDVSWTSSNTSIATVSDGIVKAVKSGTSTIKVTTSDGGKTAECKVTVKAKAVSVESVRLNKSTLTLTAGDSETLTATLSPSNATNKNVIWTSSNTSVVTVNNGVVKAMKSGTSTIRVTTSDGGKTAECKVTVKAKAVSVESVRLNKSTLTLTAGDSETLTATVSPSNATNKNVSWYSSNTTVATVSNGIVKALKTGTTTIRVTTSDGGKKSECQVTVKAKVISIESVSLNKSSLTLTEGDSETLTAVITPSNATNKGVTWTSSDPSVATVNDGIVKALKAGTATIKVITDDNGKTAECQVAVKAKVIRVESVSLNKSSLTLTEGDSETLTAVVTPSNATNKGVTWTSSNPSVATVNNGIVKALKAGTATIKVTTADGGKTTECQVTVVVIINVESVSLNKSRLILFDGDSETLTAVVSPSNATNKDVTWTSDDPSVATVNNGIVKALKAGAANIKVTTADGGKTAMCRVIVDIKISGGHEGAGEKEW